MENPETDFCRQASIISSQCCKIRLLSIATSKSAILSEVADSFCFFQLCGASYLAENQTPWFFLLCGARSVSPRERLKSLYFPSSLRRYLALFYPQGLDAGLSIWKCLSPFPHQPPSIQHTSYSKYIYFIYFILSLPFLLAIGCTTLYQGQSGIFPEFHMSLNPFQDRRDKGVLQGRKKRQISFSSVQTFEGDSLSHLS